MIPQFPEFKCIEWSDKADAEQFTNGFPPYSDFNFVSLWSWNTRDMMKFSQLNGNLVVLFYDYVSETPFLSFIGCKEIAGTAHTLLEYSKKHYQVDFLKLVPEAVAECLPNGGFAVLPDEDSYDYIVSVQHLSTLDTQPRSSSPAGYHCRRCLRLYPNLSVQDCLVSGIATKEYTRLFASWAKNKSLDHAEMNEYSAFVRFIHNMENGNRVVSLYDGTTLMGFATYEILSGNYAICHFAKANTNYKGVYDRLYQATGGILQKQNILYWNFEQDLGIPGLRQAKRKYDPIYFLKKFIVQNL